MGKKVSVTTGHRKEGGNLLHSFPVPLCSLSSHQCLRSAIAAASDGVHFMLDEMPTGFGSPAELLPLIPHHIINFQLFATMKSLSYSRRELCGDDGHFQMLMRRVGEFCHKKSFLDEVLTLPFLKVKGGFSRDAGLAIEDPVVEVKPFYVLAKGPCVCLRA